jgi:lysophospholipase L1-like esterase
MATRRTSLGKKLLLLAVALLLALGLGEGLLRWFVGPPRTPGQLSYRDADGNTFDSVKQAIARGMVVPLDPATTPNGRPRYRFAPGMHGYLCYSDAQRLHRDWLDANGCVEVRINRFGLRERDDIAPENKPPDERRIVCIGDSFTFGWGIPVEQGWVRLLEDGLRKDGKNVRTVNCGAAGALVTDEYWYGLKHRFGAFQPDCVIVTLCLNDLLPSNGLCPLGSPPPKPTGWLLFDYARQLFARNQLELDPKTDWVGALLGLNKEQSDASRLTGLDAPFDAMWSQGTPQESLRAMRDWCQARHVTFLVTLWPFLQGLGDGEFYPFIKMHELVAAFCQQEGIPFLDLLPSLRGHRPRDLWVTPADMHPNPMAQILVIPRLTKFVLDECGF